MANHGGRKQLVRKGRILTFLIRNSTNNAKVNKHTLKHATQSPPRLRGPLWSGKRLCTHLLQEAGLFPARAEN